MTRLFMVLQAIVNTVAFALSEMGAFGVVK